MLVLQGSVATKLSYGVKFFILVMSHFFLIPTLKEFKNWPTFAKVTVKIQVAQFFDSQCIYATSSYSVTDYWSQCSSIAYSLILRLYWKRYAFRSNVVRRFWRLRCECIGSSFRQCQKFSFRSCFGGDFWRAAKTGSRRCTPVTFGRQPAQVFSRPWRRTQSVLTQRRNFWLERLTE